MIIFLKTNIISPSPQLSSTNSANHPAKYKSLEESPG